MHCLQKQSRLQAANYPDVCHLHEFLWLGLHLQAGEMLSS